MNEIIEVNEVSQEVINAIDTVTQETVQVYEPTMEEKLTDGVEIMGIGIGIVINVIFNNVPFAVEFDAALKEYVANL